MDRRNQILVVVLLSSICLAGAYLVLGTNSDSETAQAGPLRSGEVVELLRSVELPVIMRQIQSHDPDLVDVVIGHVSQNGTKVDFGFIVTRPGSRGLSDSEEREWIAKVPDAVLISGCGNVAMIEPSLRRRPGESKEDASLRAHMYAQIKRGVCDDVYGPDSSYAL